MNISLILLTAIITTTGLFFFIEYSDGKRVSSVKKLLGLLTIAPLLSILIKLLFAMAINLNNAVADATSVADTTIATLPETILSAFIGDAVGFVIWGIYHWVKR